MTIYLLPGTWIRLFVFAIHVGAYWGRFRIPAAFKTQHFVTIAWAFAKKKKKKVKKSAERENANLGRQTAINNPSQNIWD